MSNVDLKTPDSKEDILVACPDCGHQNPSWRSRCEKCDQSLKAGVAKKKVIQGKFQKPEKKPGGVCQKCGSRPGASYTFFYLKRVIASKKAQLSDFEFGGEQTECLCESCAMQHRGKELRTFGLFLLFFLFAAVLGTSMFVTRMGQSNGDWGVMDTIYISAGLMSLVYATGYIVVLIRTLRGGLKLAGESLSIDLWKGWLKEQGYKTILHPDEYEKLKAR